MSFKVDTSGSTKSNDSYDQDTTPKKEPKKFIKQEGDNKLFPEIQVKDISKLIDSSTIGMLDADTIIYQAASNAENKFILVEHKEDKTVSEELQGIREFKGLTKLVSEVSWLGIENIKREVKGLPLWEVSDFTITDKASLKYDTEEEALSQAKIAIHTKLKKMRTQFGIDNITLVMGEGDNFRHKLPLCKPYKGNRKDTARPIILKKLRAWVLSNLSALEATPRKDGKNIEADDLVEFYGREGYITYRKTGIFSHVVLASDKDAMGHAKLLINPDTHAGKNNPLRGQFKIPNAMLIEATDRSAGGVDLKVGSAKKEIKGYGLKWLIYQAILGEDSADNYSCIKHLGRKFNYGEVKAYEDLLPLTTAKDVIQKAVDVIAGLLPYGVQYTTFDGKELDVDSMTYMDTYFKVAYMMKSHDDVMDFYKLCKVFKVDTSAVLDNNKLTPPVRTFITEDSEKVVDELKVLCENILPDLKGYKSAKKDELLKIIDRLITNVGDVNSKFEDFYDMIQTKKNDDQ